MANDTRYEYGHDNRIDLLKRALDQHLKDNSNPHEVDFGSLIGIDAVQAKIISKIEAGYEDDDTGNGNFYLYLYDYNDKLIDKVHIATGTVVDWTQILGDPTTNDELKPYLYRIDLTSDGIGYTIIPEFEDGTYSFKTEYNLDTLDFSPNEDTLYEDTSINCRIKTHSDYIVDNINYKKCIEFTTVVNNIVTTYCYFKYTEAAPLWYIKTPTGYNEFTGSLSFILDHKKIFMDKEEILAEIIDYVEGE